MPAWPVFSGKPKPAFVLPGPSLPFQDFEPWPPLRIAVCVGDITATKQNVMHFIGVTGMGPDFLFDLFNCPGIETRQVRCCVGIEPPSL